MVGLTYARRKAAQERSETIWPPVCQTPTRRRSRRATIAAARSVRAPTYTSVLFHIPIARRRTGRDSNPRCPCGHTGFRDRRVQPTAEKRRVGEEGRNWGA